MREREHRVPVRTTGRLVPAAFVLAGLLACAAGQSGPAGAGKPAADIPTNKAMKYRDYNIVLVSFDALQAAHVHSLGYPKEITPTIDAMASEGFNFTNAISVASWTVPASMTWFTGVYPSDHRVLNKYSLYDPPVEKISKLRELSPNIMTLAEVMKQNGYVTGGFTGDAGVGGVFGYNIGFDVYEDSVTFGDMDQSVPKALAWLKENKGRKFFLFLHGYDSHGQCIPQGGLDYRFVDKDYDGKYTGSKEEQEDLREEGLANGKVDLRSEDVKFWRAVYDEKINRADARFRKFLDGLKELGVLDKTVFVLTSDHGTEFYEHRRFDHGFSLYNELIHVPLIIRVPDRRDGKTVTGTVSSIDVMPTILDIMDVQVPDTVTRQLRGKTLVPVMNGATATGDVYSETDYRLYTYKRSITTQDGWKFIYTLESNGRELYNLKSDPRETMNLVDTEPRVAYEMEQKLFGFYKSTGHDLTAGKWVTGLSPVYPSQAKGARKK